MRKFANISLFIFLIALLFRSPAVLAQGTGEPSATRTLAWGSNKEKQLGLSGQDYIRLPRPVAGLSNYKEIAAGEGTNLGLRSDGSVWRWGASAVPPQPPEIPVPVPDLGEVKAVSASRNFLLALRADGRVWVLPPSETGSPTLVDGVTDVVSISAGVWHNLALKSDGTVWGWGSNSLGELGDGTTTPSSVPVQAQGLNGVKAVSAGRYFSMALKQDGTVWTWGDNSSGQSDGVLPGQVQNLAQVTAIASDHADSRLALTSDGSVWAWGYNGPGMLGDFNGESSAAPVKVNGLAGISAIATRYRAALALGSDGSVWSWGRQLPIQVSPNSEINGPSVPTRLIDAGISKITVGGYYAFALGSGESGPADPAAPHTFPIGSDPNDRFKEFIRTVRHNSNVELLLASTDYFGSGVKGITYSATGAQPIPETTLPGEEANLVLSQEGETTVTFYAEDQQGNREAPQTVTVILDRAKPVLNVSMDPPAVKPGGTVQFIIQANEPMLNVSVSVTVVPGSPNREVVRALPTEIPNTYRCAFDVPNTAASPLGITVRGADLALNTAEVEGVLPLDFSPPEISASISGVAGANGWFTGTATVELTAHDAGAGLDRIFYGLNAPGCTAESTSGCAVYTQPLSIAEDGRYTLTFFGRDRAGNVGPAQQRTFHVNRTPPSAGNQTLTLNEDQANEIVLTASDPGFDDPSVFAVVQGPLHGTLGPLSGNTLTYTPAQDFNGTDSFTFKANDGNFDSAPATVSLVVQPQNDPPSSRDQAVTVLKDRPHPIRLDAEDPDQDSLTVSVTVPPQHGALTGSALQWSYAPDPGFVGTDSFSYTVSDGTISSPPASVALNVIAPWFTIGRGSAKPGQTLTLPILLTDAVPDAVTGFDLQIKVTPTDGAPPLNPGFSLGAGTSGWTLLSDPRKPWTVSIVHQTPLVGPSELLKLNLQVDPATPPDTVYRLEAEAVNYSDGAGGDHPIPVERVEGGVLVVTECDPVMKGDVNADGTLNISDVIPVLRMIVNLDPIPNLCVARAADVNCDGEIKLGDAVLMLQAIVLSAPFPVCP